MISLSPPPTDIKKEKEKPKKEKSKSPMSKLFSWGNKKEAWYSAKYHAVVAVFFQSSFDVCAA